MSEFSKTYKICIQAVCRYKASQYVEQSGITVKPLTGEVNNIILLQCRMFCLLVCPAISTKGSSGWTVSSAVLPVPGGGF